MTAADETAWRPREGEIVGALTPSVETLGDPAARRTVSFTSRGFPDGLMVGEIAI